MSENDFNKKAKTIRAVYQKYTAELARLSKEQNKIIKDFIKALESKKIEKLRNILNSK